METLNDVREGKYEKTILILVLVVLLYIGVTGWNKSKQQNYLDEAGADLPTRLATDLHNAINPSGYSYLQGLDGTDTTSLFDTATKITDYAAVSKAYRVLYNTELTTDLEKELSRTDLAKFWDLVYKRTGSSTSGTTTTTTSAGRKVVAKETVNVRAFGKPAVVDHQAKKGDYLGTYIAEKIVPDIPNKGNRVLFVQVRVPAFFGLYTVDYFVSKASVTIS